MATFAERMRAKTNEVRGGNQTYREYKNAADITAFFEKHVVLGATDKIQQRAEQGHFTANILEYGYTEYFYVDAENNIIRMPKWQLIQGMYMHRIYTVVHGDQFQKLLSDFSKSLGDMRVSCWRPGSDATNVVTMDWSKPNPNPNPIQSKVAAATKASRPPKALHADGSESELAADSVNEVPDKVNTKKQTHRNISKREDSNVVVRPDSVHCDDI